MPPKIKHSFHGGLIHGMTFQIGLSQKQLSITPSPTFLEHDYTYLIVISDQSLFMGGATKWESHRSRTICALNP